MATFTLEILFTDIKAKSSLEAAKKIKKCLLEDSCNVVYNVKNEDTGEKFTVDLGECDKDVVLPLGTVATRPFQTNGYDVNE